MPDIVGLAARDWGTSLCKSLEDMWRQSVVCDTVIYANDGQTFNAHAAVLMASSPHLKTLLWAHKKQVFSVEINSINSDTWTAVLNFMYTGKSTVERNQLEVIFEAAEKLEIPELSQLCLQQLNNQPLAPGATDLGSEAHLGQVHDLSSKEPDAPTDLSIKPNPGGAPELSSVMGMNILNNPMFIAPQGLPGQIRPGMPFPFPFPPGMVPNNLNPFMPNRPPMHPQPNPALRPSLPSPSMSPKTNNNDDEDQDKRHQCNVCGKRFRLRHVLQQHALTHTSLKPYFCDICGFKARQKAVIWKHKKLKHGKDSNKNSPIKSNMTMEEIAAIAGDVADFASSSSGNVSPREFADPISPQESSLENNDLKVSPEPIQISPSGPPPPPPLAKLPILDSPTSSFMHNSNSKEFTCRTCSKTFRNKHVLAQHELIHSNFRPYACDYCNFRAKQKAVIWRHIKVKHPDMKEVSYRTESPPKDMEQQQPPEIQPSPVKEPPQEIQSKSSAFGNKINNVLEKLKTSISSRKKSRSYDMFGGVEPSPTMVPMNSPGPVTLTGYNFLRRYQCRICNKMFKNKHILLQHELVHSNLRPYKCEFCGFRAKQKAVMWRHHKSRHPEKGRVRIVEDMDLTLLHEASIEAAMARSDDQGNMEGSPLTNGLDDQGIDDNSKQGNDNEIDEEMDVSMNGNDQHVLEEDDLEDIEEDEKSDDEDEGDAFFCGVCGKGFNDEASMEKHKLKHSDFKPISCDECSFRCREEATLEKHKRIKHASGKVEQKNGDDDVPKLEEGPAQPFQQSPYSLSPGPQKNRLFYCNMCDFCTRHQTSLSRHKRLKHEGETRPEDAQSQGSSLDGDLPEEANQNALKPAFANMPNNDAQPGSPAIPPAQLMNFCLQQNPVGFPMFPNPGQVMPIRMHMQQQQQQNSLMPNGGDPDKRYTCGVCGRGFKHRHVLHQHSLVHTDLKPYACEFCDFRGRQKASLWRHRQKHLAEMGQGKVPPNFQFGMDGQIQALQGGGGQPIDFSQRAVFPGDGGEDDDSLDDDIPDDGVLMAADYADDTEDNNNLHEEDEEDGSEGVEGDAGEVSEEMEAFAEEVEPKEEASVVPTADGQYACSVCGKILASKMSMQRHVHTHRTGKCYKCQECGYQTAYSFALQRHIRVHTGERPYSCDLCDKTFTQSGSLQWHKQHHHNDAVEQAAA